MLHHVTSRPYTTQCQIEWPRPGEDFIHEKGAFQKTTGVRSFYVIHPDWLSEDANPPQPRGRSRHAWPWEFPGARDTYGRPVDRLRYRLLNDRAIEEEKRRHAEHSAYQTRHNSPWYVNNPSINPQANSLYHRDPRQPHTLPHNNARRVLTAELRQPPMEERFRRYGDLAQSLDKSLFPDLRHHGHHLIPHVTYVTPSQSAEEAARFRLMSNSYRTHCDWR